MIRYPLTSNGNFSICAALARRLSRILRTPLVDQGALILVRRRTHMLAIRVTRTPAHSGEKGQGSGITPGLGAEPSHVLWMLSMPSQRNACSSGDVCFPLRSSRSISLHQLIPHSIV